MSYRILREYDRFRRGDTKGMRRSMVRFLALIDRKEGEEILEEFTLLTQWVWDQGFRKYRARLIMGKLRWDRAIRVKREKLFALNDHWTPMFARLMVECQVVPATFFEFRDQENLNGPIETSPQTLQSGSRSQAGLISGGHHFRPLTA